MFLPELRFEQPDDIQGVLTLLARHGAKARLLAGGTDVVVELKMDPGATELLVSLMGLEELKTIAIEGSELRLGALTSVNQVAASEAVRGHLPALAEAAADMASNQVRNMATLGGNICSAVPSADLPPSLIAADAGVTILGPPGERRVALEDFFTGPRRNCLAAREVLTHILVPGLPPDSGTAYLKFSARDGNACTAAAVAARLTLADGLIARARVVLGAVAPVPLLAKDTNELLVGQRPSKELFSKAAKEASLEASPITDVRGTDEFRRELIDVLTRRALFKALERAGGGTP